MSGVLVIRRRRRIAAARPFNHITKAEHAETMRVMAESLLPYADQPHARESALQCLDRAEALERSPRCGWYPKRPPRRARPLSPNRITSV